MGRGAVLRSVGGVCAALACALTARAQTPISAPDGADKLTLFAAAFAAQTPAPSSQRVTAMAFLPGRGVVSWDVTGKTPAEAREAEVEAMGLADARAVQREIDAAEAEKRAELERETKARQAPTVGAGTQRVALASPPTNGASRDAAGALPLSRAAVRGGGGLNLRNGESLRDKSRVYAFAAASNRGVGFNVLQEDAGWKTAGLTADQGGFAGQRQAGFAWRKGAVQTSLSYVQQKDRTQVLGIQTDKDHRVMLSTTVQPSAILDLFAKKP
jgi:hypothetical protein